VLALVLFLALVSPHVKKSTNLRKILSIIRIFELYTFPVFMAFENVGHRGRTPASTS
jgi:hypothetical protein